MYSTHPKLDRILAMLENRDLTEDTYQEVLLYILDVEPQLELFHQFEGCLLALDNCYTSIKSPDSRYIGDIDGIVAFWVKKALESELGGLVDHRQCPMGADINHLLAQPCHYNQPGQFQTNCDILRTIRDKYNQGTAFVLPSALIDLQKIEGLCKNEADIPLMIDSAKSLARALERALGRPLFDQCFFTTFKRLER